MKKFNYTTLHGAISGVIISAFMLLGFVHPLFFFVSVIAGAVCLEHFSLTFHKHQ